MNRLPSRRLSWRSLFVLRRNTTYTTNTQGTGYRVKGSTETSSVLLSLCLAVAAIAWSCTLFAQGAGKAEYEVYPCRYKPVRDS